ncbi:transcription repressor NadR [Enterococcus camelliae]|uniref:Transcription repressor NadR n=1 Tax=Enterococcus camelliae TaxID=453959 RepID=A0ABW5TN66_9ENTE
MDGETRRREILQALQCGEQPISASRLAKQFQVSRQIIVGDIALLRAGGEAILATARGYILEEESQGVVVKIAVCHRSDQVKEELQTIVSLGGEVIDVIVDHLLYGELRGSLGIQTMDDIEEFMHKYTATNEKLLSNLTNGVHLHTIRCDSLETVSQIKQALRAKKMLFEE